jgi:hypothetical protein
MWQNPGGGNQLSTPASRAGGNEARPYCKEKHNIGDVRVPNRAFEARLGWI